MLRMVKESPRLTSFSLGLDRHGSRHFTRYDVIRTSTEAGRLSAAQMSVNLSMKRKVRSSTTKVAKESEQKKMVPDTFLLYDKSM